MNDKERLTLQKFHTRLVKDIIPSETFLGEFIQQGILDFDLKEEILNETTDSAKNAKFLSILPRRGPDAFPVLLQVLERTSPWIKDELETFYNKQKRLKFNGDRESLFPPSQEVQPSDDDTSPKTLDRESVDTAVQTETDEDGEQVKLKPCEVLTLNNIYLRIVTYLHSQGHKDFDIVVSAVEPDLLDKVVREILNIVSTKQNQLTQIINQFDEQERESAGNDVCQLVKNVISQKASLKGYRDNKDIEVMQMEKAYNAQIAELEGQITDLEANVDSEHDNVVRLEKKLSEKEAEIQKMEETEQQRQQEPLLKRMHNLIEEVTEAKCQKEKQMYATGQEYQDLAEETKCIEALLYQLKDVHDNHVIQQRKDGVRTDYRRRILHNVGNGTINSQMATSNTRSDGPTEFGMSSNIYGNSLSNSSRLSRNPRRRLKRSPNPQNRQRLNVDNVPMSPKQKTPRYQQSTLSKQMTEMQVENRPVTRQSTNLSRCTPRQDTDISLLNGHLSSPGISRQSTGYLSSRQNTNVSRRTSSRQSNRISLDLNLSARSKQTGLVRNGTDLSRNGQSRTSFRSEDASPLQSARQTPCTSPQLLFIGTPRSVGTGTMSGKLQVHSGINLCSMR